MRAVEWKKYKRRKSARGVYAGKGARETADFVVIPKKYTGLVGRNQHQWHSIEVKQGGEVYDKVKNKIYFITNAAATALVRRSGVSVFIGVREIVDWIG